MDKTSKKILKMLRNNPDEYFMYEDDIHKTLNISESEFFRCVKYLSDQGLLEFISNQNGTHLGISASHKDLHRKSIKFENFKQWFFHSFLGGFISGIITGVISTLIVTKVALPLLAWFGI